MVQNVVHAEKRTIGEKSVIYRSLTERGRLSMVVKSFLNLQKGNLIERSISIAFRLVIKVKTAKFQISHTSIPCQLIRSPRMRLKPS